MSEHELGRMTVYMDGERLGETQPAEALEGEILEPGDPRGTDDHRWQHKGPAEVLDDIVIIMGHVGAMLNQHFWGDVIHARRRAPLEFIDILVGEEPPRKHGGPPPEKRTKASWRAGAKGMHQTRSRR